ncbi:MAG TPA: site-2 protease family protein [Paucimonas sp.]|nr:site-2 protease family protein [Paucimonas sp.]
MNEIIQTIAVIALPLIFAITLHEAAHAYAAKYFGDTTAYSQGRMTLNPVKHIDPLGTILLPLIFFLVGSPFIIGYAKPVPVDFGKLRKPKRDMAWVALAGPAANFVMALLSWILLVLLHAGGVEEPYFMAIAKAGVTVNLLFFAFNLFPLPPLDGGRILTSLLPHNYAYKFARIEPYGFFILIGLLYFQVLGFWIGPVQNIAQVLIGLIVSPLSFLLN